MLGSICLAFSKMKTMKSIDRYLSILGLGIVLSGLSTAAYACPPQTTHGAKIPSEFTQPPKHSSQSRNHSLTPAQPTNGVKVPAEFTQPQKK